MWEYLFWQDEVARQRIEREEAEELAAFTAEDIAQLTAQGLVSGCCLLLCRFDFTESGWKHD
jgi:hypothetical protein